MTKAFALIDTVQAIPGVSTGKVISTHRTMNAAKRADRKVQAAASLAGARNFPTKIVALSAFK
jgi:hypothetical protein